MLGIDTVVRVASEPPFNVIESTLHGFTSRSCLETKDWIEESGILVATYFEATFIRSLICVMPSAVVSFFMIA